MKTLSFLLFLTFLTAAGCGQGITLSNRASGSPPGGGLGGSIEEETETITLPESALVTGQIVFPFQSP